MKWHQIYIKINDIYLKLSNIIYMYKDQVLFAVHSKK